MLRNAINNTQCTYIKCANHPHNNIQNIPYINDVLNTINIKIAFHFLAPRGSYNKNKVFERTHDVIMSLNNDFNNYSINPNIMNNFKYKSIVNQVFISNMDKQHIYLDKDFINELPSEPSGITFEFGELYYYPITSQLKVSQHTTESKLQIIKEYIILNRADAIEPEKILNIWIVDMIEESILGFSNFPWEEIDSSHGIVINRKTFFPDKDISHSYGNLKTITHHVGHYLGLLHSNNNPIYDIPEQLLTDITYNPLFMNFMDYTYDKYVGIFTRDQITEMRQMILFHRSQLNSMINNVILPTSKYSPDTNLIGISNGFSERSVEKYESTNQIPIPNKKKDNIICRVTRKADLSPQKIQSVKYESDFLDPIELKTNQTNINSSPKIRPIYDGLKVNSQLQKYNNEPYLTPIDNTKLNVKLIQPSLNSVSEMNINPQLQKYNNEPYLTPIDNTKVDVAPIQPSLNSVSNINIESPKYNNEPYLTPIDNTKVDIVPIQPLLNSVSNINSRSLKNNNEPDLTPVNNNKPEIIHPSLNSVFCSAQNEKLCEINTHPQLIPIKNKCESEIIEPIPDCYPKMESITIVPKLDQGCNLKNAPELKPIFKSNCCPKADTVSCAPIVSTTPVIRYRVQPVIAIAPIAEVQPIQIEETPKCVVRKCEIKSDCCPSQKCDDNLTYNKYGQKNKKNPHHRVQLTVRTADTPSNRFVRTRPINV